MERLMINFGPAISAIGKDVYCSKSYLQLTIFLAPREVALTILGPHGRAIRNLYNYSGII
jgi:hypothetical protein